ncbi:MAG: CPBP family intramembrane metalloprotease [Opitutales bacterium]|nr:CPBP family intramembrane metalloprotease [Opitutales bacterium]
MLGTSALFPPLSAMIVFVIAAVVVPLTAFVERRRMRETLNALDGHTRPPFYRHQAILLLVLGGLGLLPVFLGHARPEDLGYTAPASARFFIVCLLVAAVWLALRRAVDRFAASPGFPRAFVRIAPPHLRAMTPHNKAEQKAWGNLCLGAGLGEETLYRGFMVWFLTPAIGVPGGIVGGAAFFAMAHGYQGIRFAGIVFLAGLAFGGLYVFAGSLLPVIALHTLYDWEMGRLYLAYNRSGETGEE